MLKSSLEKQTTSNHSVNIRVIKPGGISSVWNWFTNKNKKSNLQNLMFDKKIRLKLNAEELDALKRNGIDLQKLQNIATSNDSKLRKNIFILSKDQSELNKNVLLNNSVLCDLMKNKSVSKKPRKYKKSLVSSSTLSIKSKNNVINSNVTYIHSIKSKKSIVNSVSSKASVKVGLKSHVDVPFNPFSKNILMKEIPEALLKGNMQKKVFVPIYLGKKKSSKTNKGEKTKNVENKLKSENESNVIPLLLTKLKTMEGQISDIENTTKKINEVVSQKNMFNVNNHLKVSKGSNPVQPNIKGLATHKMYRKRSLKKFKQNKADSKCKSNTLTSNNSSYNTDFSFNSVAGLKNAPITMNNKNKMSNIKNIFDNPEHFLKHHSFVIPSNLSEKTLFKANPNVGCDVILKLFEALTQANDSQNEASSDKTQSNKLFMNIDNIDSPRQNLSNIKSEMGSSEKLKGLSSISESQMAMIGNKTGSQNKNCSQQKKNISCPSSSTAISYEYNTEEQKLASKNSLNTFLVEKDNDQVHATPENESNCIDNEIKTIQVNKIVESKIDTPSPGNKPYIFVSKKESKEDNAKNKSMIGTKEGFAVGMIETLNNPNSPSSLSQSKSILVEMEKKELHLPKMVPDNKILDSSIKSYNDDSNLKLEENINLKSVKLRIPEGQIEKQVIKLPIATDSTNICSICIEPARDLNPAKQSEVDVEGTKSSSDTKKEPKFSITILVKNNLNEEMLYNNDITMSNNNNNESKKNSFVKVDDDQQCTAVKRSILPVSLEDGSTIHQSSEKNVNFDSEKYIPPLRFETSTTSPTSLATCGFVDKSNFNKEKGLNKLNLNHKTDEFGIEGVTYLNQEQRKKLDAELSSSVCKKKSQELKNTTLKQGAKSSINLKNNSIPVRHLSESSLNFQKTTVRNIYKQSTQPIGTTVFKSIKNCRKNPYNPMECLKFRKELDITNRLQAEYTNMKLTSSQGLDCVAKAITRKKEEFYVLSNTSNSVDNIRYFDSISKTLNAVNNKTGHNEFFVVCNEKPLEGSIKTEVHPNSSCIKKRSHRCHMTLKEPILNHLQDDLLHDQMGIGDHQTNSIKLIPIKEIDSSRSVDSFGKSNIILNPLNEETPTINLGDDINVKLHDDSNFLITSQSKRSPNEDYVLASSSAPTTFKCPSVLAKATPANDNVQNRHLNDWSNDKVTSQLKESVDPNCGLGLGVPEESISCSCILTMVEKPCPNKQNIDLINVTDHKVASTSDSPVPPECGLVSLSLYDLPKCCPCILAKAHATTETIFRSQAEVLLEKSGPTPGKIWKISIICNKCMRKFKNMDSSLGTNNTDPAQDTYNKHDHLAIIKPEQNLKDNKVCNAQLEQFNIKSEITAEVLSGKPIILESQCITNENNPGNTRDKQPDKPENETTHGEEKKIPCYHTCLTTPSDDSMNCDISEKKPNEAFCLDVIPDSDFSNEHDIGKGILRYYSNNNNAYSEENIANTTTVFHFNGKENITFYKIIPDEKPETNYGTKGYIDSTEYMEYRENNDNANNMENNDNRSLRNSNRSLVDPYKNVRNVSNSCTQRNGTQSSLKAEDDWFDNVNPMGTSTNNYSGLVPNRGNQYMAENLQSRAVKKDTYKSFKRSMLNTIKETDLERNSRDAIANDICPQSPVVSSATNYIVNCVHSVEYDFMSENRNAIFACSVNSYCSTNGKI